MEIYRLVFLSGLFVLLNSACSEGVSCPHCGRDFLVLGRHLWRCTSRGTSSDLQSASQPITAPPATSPGNPPSCVVSPQLNLRPKRRERRPSAAASTSQRMVAPSTVARFQGDDPNQQAASASIDAQRAVLAPLDTSHPPPSPSFSSPRAKFTCHCGRQFATYRGLRSHQRACSAVDSLLRIDPNVNRIAGRTATTAVAANCTAAPGAATASNVACDYTSTTTNVNNTRCTVSLQAVQGLRLPRAQSEWAEAHAYFLLHPPLPEFMNEMNETDLNNYAATFQGQIYDYFYNTWGSHRPAATRHAPGSDHASNRSIRMLRQQLKELKLVHAPADCIQLVSKQLRMSISKIAKSKVKKNLPAGETKLNNISYRNNPWNFMHSFKADDINSPTFCNSVCESYFQDILTERNPGRVFQKPDWMSSSPPPLKSFPP